MVKVKQESSYQMPKAGTHVAVIIGVFDVGYHFNERYQKKEHAGYIVLELDERDTQGKHIELSKKITLDNLGDKSNLKKYITAALGRDLTAQEQATGFDTDELLGKAIQINVNHYQMGDKKGAGVETVMPIMEGVKSFKPDKLYTAGSDDPKWIVDKRSKAIENKVSGVQEDDEDSDIPF